MITPFELDKGIHLENSDVLLPWGSPYDMLASLGKVTTSGELEIANLCWENEAVFNGLPVRINMQGALGGWTFFLDRTHEAPSPELEFANLLEALTDRLGRPHFMERTDGCPRARWVWCSVSVSLRRSDQYNCVACVLSKERK